MNKLLMVELARLACSATDHTSIVSGTNSYSSRLAVSVVIGVRTARLKAVHETRIDLARHKSYNGLALL